MLIIIRNFVKTLLGKKNPVINDYKPGDGHFGDGGQHGGGQGGGQGLG
jgi:hypothetical protein